VRSCSHLRVFVLLSGSALHRHLHSFPTRRSSDLDADGRLSAIAHDVVEQTSTVQEFAEQTAVVTRMMYASPTRRTTHRLVALDRSEEHTSELQSPYDLVCRLLLEQQNHTRRSAGG